MIGTTRVRCLCCRALVQAVVGRAGTAPRMVQHDAGGLPCPALGCEPVGAEAERERRARDTAARDWAATTQRIGVPRTREKPPTS